jgi:CheY-like chemotaxis protein
VNQKFALTVLQQAGHITALAHNGQEALEAVQKEHFDAILMDVQMPVMDGFAFARAMRKLGVTSRIIAMIAHAMDGFREFSLAAGMNDYISKPIHAIAILKKLSNLRDSIEENQAQPEATPIPPAAVIELGEALLMVDGDDELLIGLAPAGYETAGSGFARFTGTCAKRRFFQSPGGHTPTQGQLGEHGCWARTRGLQGS